MHLLLAAALLDTIIAPVLPDTIEVHEWGVVLFGEYEAAATAAPWSGMPVLSPDPDIYGIPTSVEVPVIFFHGPEFTGDLIVDVKSGNITRIYPREDMISTGDSITWSDISVISAGPEVSYEEASPVEFLSDDILQSWRGMECNTVRLPGGEEEGFLFYECLLSDPLTLDYPWLLPEGGVLPEHVSSVLLFLRPYGDYQEMYLVDPASILMPVETEEIGVYDRYRVVDILCGWNDGELYSRELELLWDTWEPYVTSYRWNGDALVVFPLDRRGIQSVSGLELLPDQDIPVDYGRFFLGMMSVSWDRPW